MVTHQQFLVYNYYYTLQCGVCDNEIPTLDFAEVIGTHPMQIGDIHPHENLQVWLPILKEIPYQPKLKSWGNHKLKQMTVNIKMEEVDEVSGESKMIWDRNAHRWMELTRKGDVNHREILIPKMIELMDPEMKRVMDIACGEGSFTRAATMKGFSMFGTDVSNLIDYAIETETKQQLGIDYKKIGVHKLSEHFDENEFDQVTCNMALMDIDNLQLILENVRYILRPGGQFVFSISHPVFAWPVSRTIKLPRDSEHNEDKGWIVDNYLAEQPTKVHLPEMPSPMLYYPRMISTYVNSLVNTGFVIIGLSEPKLDYEKILRFPRDFYNDYDRNPPFMLFQTKLRA